MNKVVLPIGVFDSGIGGLSVLQALRHELPDEHFVYLADSAHAPYGEKGDAFVQLRTHAIAQHLRERHRIKALVIACNTATAAAVESLRASVPELPTVGVEPAIKPATSCSQTRHIGVMATRGTVESLRFQKLLQTYARGAHFHVQACDGLARAIEGCSGQQDADGVYTLEAKELCQRYLEALGEFGLKTGQIDTLVLGCTHYIFIKDMLRKLLGHDVHLIDTGAAVARQTRRLLDQAGSLNVPENADAAGQFAPAQQIKLITTGSLVSLQAAAQRWLNLPAQCCRSVQI